MPGTRVTIDQEERFWEAIRNNASQRVAARHAGFSEATAKRLLKKPSNGREFREARQAKEIPDTPTPLADIGAEARAALEDRSGFLFCKRYFGIELSPWQQESWRVMEDAWDSSEREFMLENAPPGGGKSTKMVMFFAKRVVLNRAVRLLFISRAQSLAERNTMRLRRALERTSPAVGAEATLSADFGRFKPKQGGDVWKRDEFVVEQMDGSPIEEKEPTCSAFGFDSEWLGNRLDGVAGDDLDSTRSIRNMEIVEKNRDIFDNELEPRLEPGGLFFLAQQRLGAFDFSNHVLSKVILPDEDGSGEQEGTDRQYRHVVFRAHYEDRCRGRESHKAGAPPYPEGCLLDPRALPYRDVKKAMNNPQRFKVVYQQEDPGEDDALVQRIWIDGGRGSDGVEYLGCWDVDRGAWQLPRTREGALALSAPLVGVVTVDPSPTRYWSVQAWVVHPETEQRFLLDIHRERMDAPDFLDWSHSLGAHTGLLEDWWHLFSKLGVPLQYVIVEVNAAQRFMLQYDAFRRWQQRRAVNLVPHSTHRNKADPNYGVQMIASRWRAGQVRLPGKTRDPGRVSSMRLVDEVTRWPHSATDDCVMGQWFLEHNIDNLISPQSTVSSLPVPTWMRAA